MAAALAAQGTAPHYVLSALAPGGPSQVYRVDPQSGVVQLELTLAVLGDPLALASDPFNGDLIVAIDDGFGQSQILRLDGTGGSWVPQSMGSVPGRACGVAVAFGELLVAIEGGAGGVWRLPRLGGPGTLEVSVPNLTAMETYSGESGLLMLARTGVASTATPASGVALYSMGNAYYPFPMTSIVDPQARRIVGVLDALTAVPRQLLSFDDGSFGFYQGFVGGSLQPVPASQAGGNIAMHREGAFGASAMVLGGSPPVLSSIDIWGQVLTPVSQPLPGIPVDFAYGLSRAPRSLRFGQSCGPMSLTQNWVGSVQVGGAVTLTAGNLNNAPFLLVAGLDDYEAGQVPLQLPGGCLLGVRPDVVLFEPSGPLGYASYTLPIPSSQTLVGTVVFTQWLHYAAAAISTTTIGAHWIGS